ncbi:MAG: hypothetical protein KBC33_01920 [Candidatus Pacebacteria bacterium]|nr:hypothetical protein [Candidatus Paceibacterota bacterium]
MTTITTKSKIIGLKELRLNMEKYVRMLQKGSSFVVVRKSSPIFKLEPVDAWGDDGMWETVVDFTQIKKGGVPAKDVLAALRKMA